jgi:hypothetical protein
MECKIYDSEVYKKSNPIMYIRIKLQEAGFDTDKPISAMVDFKENCTIYRQEDKNENNIK